VSELGHSLLVCHHDLSVFQALPIYLLQNTYTKTTFDVPNVVFVHLLAPEFELYIHAQ